MMNYAKIVSKGWANYTGHLNVIRFENGVSTEPVPDTILDRIAGVTQLVACDKNGKILGDTPQYLGIQNRMIGGVTQRAEVRAPMPRMTDEDKNMEALVDASQTMTSPSEKLYTQAELEQIASDKGIKGLREIGALWKVTGKSFPQLINGILAAQSAFLALRAKAIEAKSTSTRKLKTAEDEHVEEGVREAEPVIKPAGFEGMAVEYRIGDQTLPATDLVHAALKNSGRTLTGWNKLDDEARRAAIEAEIAAFEEHVGASLVPVIVVDEAKLPEPKPEPETATPATDERGE